MGQLLGSKYHYEINKNMKNYINCCGEERGGSDLLECNEAGAGDSICPNRENSYTN